MIGESTPDLLVLDLMMSDMSGFEVIELLKTVEEFSRIPVVVLTAMELSIEKRLDFYKKWMQSLKRVSFLRMSFSLLLKDC